MSLATANDSGRWRYLRRYRTANRLRIATAKRLRIATATYYYGIARVYAYASRPIARPRPRNEAAGWATPIPMSSVLVAIAIITYFPIGIVPYRVIRYDYRNTYILGG